MRLGMDLEKHAPMNVLHEILRTQIESGLISLSVKYIILIL